MRFCELEISSHFSKEKSHGVDTQISYRVTKQLKQKCEAFFLVEKIL